MTEQEQNKEIGRRIPEEIFGGEGNFELIDELVSDDFFDHGVPEGLPNGKAALRKFAEYFRSAFPDLTYHVDMTIADGDMIAGYMTASGTQKGEYYGIAPTNKHISWKEMHMARIKDGKMTEHWALIDTYGMYKDLDAIKE